MANQVGTTRAKQTKSAPVLYVYGVTAVSNKPLAAPRVGVDGVAPVEPVQFQKLVYWVSRVNAVEFGEQLQSNMEKLEWLANASVRHQQAVAAISEQIDVLPARFGTVFTSEATLIDDLKRRKRSITATLKRVAGAEEWGVKVFSSPETLPVAESAKSGREYLQRKAAVLQHRTKQKPDEDIVRLASALRKLSLDMAPLGKLSAGQRNLQWQASFLVRRADRAKFNAVLRQFASKQAGKTLECTGPWPPYSFVSRDGR